MEVIAIWTSAGQCRSERKNKERDHANTGHVMLANILFVCLSLQLDFDIEFVSLFLLLKTRRTKFKSNHPVSLR